MTTRSQRSEAGFSLIEIMVVLALIGLITAVMLPGTTSIFRTSLDSFARKAANLFREARDYAILSNKVVRVSFDLDKQEYWIEDASGSILLPSVKEQEEINERLNDKSGIKKKSEEDEEKKAEKNPFRLTRELNKKHQVVPQGLRIAAVISPRMPRPIQEGQAEVYYFPHGSSEAAVIHLEDMDGNRRSLILHPITGKSRLVPEFYFPSEDKR